MRIIESQVDQKSSVQRAADFWAWLFWAWLGRVLGRKTTPLFRNASCV